MKQRRLFAVALTLILLVGCFAGSASAESHEHNTLEIRSIAPTCAEPGYESAIYCTTCQAFILFGERIPATGEHDYVDGVCTVCGALSDIEPTDPEPTDPNPGEIDPGNNGGLDNAPRDGDITPYGLFAVAGLFAIAAAVWVTRKLYWVS